MRKYDRNKNYLFVDGYNIINSWQELEELSKISLEDARDALTDMLMEYSHMTNEKIILVFDAYLVKKSGGKIYHREKIDVVYTKELQTADHYIESELEKIGKLRNVRVATSDNIEQQMILARGGQRISARELEVEIKNAKKVTDALAKKLKLEAQKGKKDERLRVLEDLKDHLP